MLPEHFFWITSRAAGTASLLLSSLAVCAGLLIGGKLVKGRPDLRHLHQALSLASLAALVVHAVALLGDSYLSPSLADITIPFVSGYQRGWTTLGIVAGWAMLILGLSYYARNRIGQRRWRTCTASPRWRGSPAWCTRSARARTRAKRGSSPPSRSSCCRRSRCSRSGCSAVSAGRGRRARAGAAPSRGRPAPPSAA
jgi:hypothetical protein